MGLGGRDEPLLEIWIGGGKRLLLGKAKAHHYWCLSLVSLTTVSACTAGVLFDAAQLRPPISPAISLAEPGPRAATRLWAAVLESLIPVDASVRKKERKSAPAGVG